MILRIFLINCLAVFALLAQTTPIARYATPVELLATGISSSSGGAWTTGATNANDNYGMLYARCDSCVMATNSDRTILLPASGIGRYVAVIKPPAGGWGTELGGGNVFNTGTPTQYALPKYTDATGTNVGPSNVLTDSSGNTLSIPGNSAIGTNSVISTNALSIYGTTGGSESIMWATSSDATTDFWQLRNGTGTAGRFLPSFVGHVESAAAVQALFFIGEIAPAVDSGTTPLMTYRARLTTPAVVATRPTHDFQNNTTSQLAILANGNVGISDSSPAALLTVGSGDLFRVDSSGNLIRVRNVAYSWPSTNALAGQVMASLADGTLYWTNAASSINTLVSTKTLTDNVATDIFTVDLAASARSGLEVRFEIDVTDGTDFQTFTDTRRVSTVNKAGSVTAALSASASATATSSADTLNVTVSVSSNATTYTFVVNADTSLAGSTITMRYTILNFNGSTITTL